MDSLILLHMNEDEMKALYDLMGLYEALLGELRGEGVAASHLEQQVDSLQFGMNRK